MIIDLLTNCTTIVKCNSYSNINQSLLSSSYSIKDSRDILSWKMNINSSSTSAVEFKILSPTVKILKEINLDLIGGNREDAIITIETSLDYINWYPLIYKTDKDNKYLYVKTNNGFLNLTTKETSINDNSLQYTYKTFNSDLNLYTYLYNQEFKFLKITISNITSTISDTMYLSKFEILIDEIFNNNVKNILENKSNIFTKSKVFEDELFIPDTLKNYMKMLEENTDTITSLLITTPKLNIDINSTHSSNEGIGNDFIENDTVVY